MNDVKPEQLAGYLRGRMGLIIGPDITKFPSSFAAISNELAKKAGVIAQPRFIDTAQMLIEKGLAVPVVFDAVRQIIGLQANSALLSQLSKLRWASVLSFSLDSHFDDSFRQERDRRPSWPPITLLRTLSEPLPPKSIPFFKLMGVSTDETCAYSTTTYTVRKALWRDAAKLFRDHIKTNPVLCIGMSDASWAFIDFISDMIASRSLPRTLLLLADDPLCNNTTICSLLESRCTLLKVRGTINDVVRIASDADKFSYQPPVLFDDPNDYDHVGHALRCARGEPRGIRPDRGPAAEPSLWRLFNAWTTVLISVAKRSPQRFASLTMDLQRMLDENLPPAASSGTVPAVATQSA